MQWQGSDCEKALQDLSTKRLVQRISEHFGSSTSSKSPKLLIYMICKVPKDIMAFGDFLCGFRDFGMNANASVEVPSWCPTYSRPFLTTKQRWPAMGAMGASGSCS